MEDTMHLGQKLNDTLSQAEELGRTAARKMDQARRFTAVKLNDTAAAARRGGEAIGSCVSLQQMIRRYPSRLFWGAVLAGFLIGLTVRNVGRTATTRHTRPTAR